MIEKFNLNERIQHIILMVSFILLIITGFSLMFPCSIWTIITIRFLGGFYLRGIIHRISAVIFMILCLYHLYFIFFTKRGISQQKEMVPGIKDFFDLFQMIKYFIGIEKEKPKFGRFSYIEKSEYWALVWGSLIMIITGFFLWSETLTINLFTKLGFDISKVIHGYEAILAFLALIVWHFYAVHLNPEDFPFKNNSWLTGKMSEEKMEKDHPLELEIIKNKQSLEK